MNVAQLEVGISSGPAEAGLSRVEALLEKLVAIAGRMEGTLQASLNETAASAAALTPKLNQTAAAMQTLSQQTRLAEAELAALNVVQSGNISNWQAASVGAAKAAKGTVSYGAAAKATSSSLHTLVNAVGLLGFQFFPTATAGAFAGTQALKAFGQVAKVTGAGATVLGASVAAVAEVVAILVSGIQVLKAKEAEAAAGSAFLVQQHDLVTSLRERIKLAEQLRRIPPEDAEGMRLSLAAAGTMTDPRVLQNTAAKVQSELMDKLNLKRESDQLAEFKRQLELLGSSDAQRPILQLKNQFDDLHDTLETVMLALNKEGRSSEAGKLPAAFNAAKDAAEARAKKAVTDTSVELTYQLEQLSATTDAEAANAKLNKSFLDINQTLKALIDTGKLSQAQIADLLALGDKAFARQKSLMAFAVEQEKTKSRLMALTPSGRTGSAGSKGNDFVLSTAYNPTLREEIVATRLKAEQARTVEAFEQTTAKLELLMQERERRLKYNLMGPIESFETGWDQAVEKFGSASERMAAVGGELADSIDRNMADTFTGIITGTKKEQEAFTEMSNAIIQELIRVIIQQLIVRSIMSAFGGGGGSIMAGAGANAYSGDFLSGGSSFHEGGVVGAPRYRRGGIAGDEVQSILHRGEVVFTPEQMAALKGGDSGRSQRTEIINITDPNMIDDHLARNPNAILNVISKHRNVVRAAMGIR